MNQSFEWANSKAYAPPCKYKKTLDQSWGVVRLALDRTVSGVPLAWDTVGLTCATDAKIASSAVVRRGSVLSIHPPSALYPVVGRMER